MKNLITSFLIVAALIGGWLIFDNYSHDTSEELSCSLIEIIIPLVESEQWDDAKETYGKFEDEWNKYKKVAFAFLENDEISEIDFSVAKSNKYIEAQDVSNSSGELYCIATALELLDKREKVTFSNIL